MPAPRIVLAQGDITHEAADAIVNAANSSLLGGGGVDGAIHRAGGPAILEECRALRRTSHPEGLPAGQAVATTAGRLPARWVIHTVGPVYDLDDDPPALLASCHRSCLVIADSLGASVVAFPAISTGAFGYPLPEAATIAVRTVLGTATRVTEVRFVLWHADAHAAFADALASAGVDSSAIPGSPAL